LLSEITAKIVTFICLLLVCSPIFPKICTWSAQCGHKQIKTIGFKVVAAGVKGRVMPIVKPIGPAQVEQSTDDLSSSNLLDTLLRRVSEASTREIENLMSELHGLRKKLQSDGNRIQKDITKYTELSQGILQLATIVSDSVKKIPGASDIA
jgi:hypothetical protein